MGQANGPKGKYVLALIRLFRLGTGARASSFAFA
jgi:hypothetical protein